MTTIVVFGPPGAGKGTRIKWASEVVSNLISISTGNLLRKEGVDTSSGQLVSDELIMKILSKEIKGISEEAIVVLDGVPRNVRQANLMKKMGIQIDKAIYLPISEEEAIRRAEDRLICKRCNESYTNELPFKQPLQKFICDKCGASLSKRSDDNADTIKKRLEVFKESTLPLIDWFKAEKIPIRKIEPNSHNCFFIEALQD